MALHDREGRGSSLCLAIGWCAELLVVSVEAVLCRRACDRPHRTGPIPGILDYFFELLNFDSGYFMTSLHLCVATCCSHHNDCTLVLKVRALASLWAVLFIMMPCLLFRGCYTPKHTETYLLLCCNHTCIAVPPPWCFLPVLLPLPSYCSPSACPGGWRPQPMPSPA
jgi:hypothetical protein